jgi:hypothetical protein
MAMNSADRICQESEAKATQTWREPETTVPTLKRKRVYTDDEVPRQAPVGVGANAPPLTVTGGQGNPESDFDGGAGAGVEEGEGAKKTNTAKVEDDDRKIEKAQAEENVEHSSNGRVNVGTPDVEDLDPNDYAREQGMEVDDMYV